MLIVVVGTYPNTFVIFRYGNRGTIASFACIILWEETEKVWFNLQYGRMREMRKFFAFDPFSVLAKISVFHGANTVLFLRIHRVPGMKGLRRHQSRRKRSFHFLLYICTLRCKQSGSSKNIAEKFMLEKHLQLIKGTARPCSLCGIK